MKLQRNFSVFVVVVSVLLAYGFMEGVYRVRHYWAFKNRPVNFFVLDKNFFEFDSKSGFRYVPNLKTTLYWVHRDGTIFHQNQIAMDSEGRSRSKKMSTDHHNPLNIAMLGDSFTACITNDIPWTDYLEDHFNEKSPQFAVYNYGRDGTGIIQAADIFENEIKPSKKPFQYVILNFINADIQRKFIYRGKINVQPDVQVALTCTDLPIDAGKKYCSQSRFVIVKKKFASGEFDPIFLKQLFDGLITEDVKKINFFTLRPLLLQRIFGKYFLFEESLARFVPQPMFENETIAIRESLEALQKIKNGGIPLIAIYIPSPYEIEAGKISAFAETFIASANAKGILTYNAFDYFPEEWRKFPEQFRNFPFDGHFNNRGAQEYSKIVSKIIEKEHSTASNFPVVRQEEQKFFLEKSRKNAL